MLVVNPPREATMHPLPSAIIQLLAPFALLFFRACLAPRPGALLAGTRSSPLPSGASAPPYGSWGLGANRALPALPSRPQPCGVLESGGEPAALGIAREDVLILRRRTVLLIGLLDETLERRWGAKKKIAAKGIY